MKSSVKNFQFKYLTRFSFNSFRLYLIPHAWLERPFSVQFLFRFLKQSLSFIQSDKAIGDWEGRVYLCWCKLAFVASQAALRSSLQFVFVGGGWCTFGRLAYCVCLFGVLLGQLVHFHDVQCWVQFRFFVSFVIVFFLLFVFFVLLVFQFFIFCFFILVFCFCVLFWGFDHLTHRSKEITTSSSSLFSNCGNSRVPIM
ncbi:Hypothetical_protein [Hexamita inflata]|uniref:Hypothetical_protein n=1 Tax=Hexamita inflata TaxID=28002 RepID=A0ABP1K246_9EUKA